MPRGGSVAGELLRQGERLLDLQVKRQDSLERRAAELLRLSVAIMGGVVVVSGLLLTARVEVGRGPATAFALGVLCIMAAGFILARLVVGRSEDAPLAFGPDLRQGLQALRERGMTRAELDESLVELMPDWLSENEAVMARYRAAKAVALGLLATGTTTVAMALLYIVGGHILV